MQTFTEPASDLPEGAMLWGWLDAYRSALARKCEGLGEAALRMRATPPSTLSLLGLVRHLTEMERVHLVHHVEGTPVEFVYYSPDKPDADFDDIEKTSVDEAFGKWRAESERADVVLQAYLGEVPPHVRFRLLKVIGEYARHSGHADLIRERIDGATGQ